MLCSIIFIRTQKSTLPRTGEGMVKDQPLRKIQFLYFRNKEILVIQTILKTRTSKLLSCYSAETILRQNCSFTKILKYIIYFSNKMPPLLDQNQELSQHSSFVRRWLSLQVSEKNIVIFSTLAKFLIFLEHQAKLVVVRFVDDRVVCTQFFCRFPQ